MYKKHKGKRVDIMNGITMMIIAIVVLGGAYLLYGRYLQNKWALIRKQKLRHTKWRTELIMYRLIQM